jgi:hypothetical protein
MPSKKAEWLLKRHEIAVAERGEDVTTATNAKLVYNMLRSSEIARSGTDWVVQLGQHVVLLYGCPEPSCMHYPLRSNNWWRLIKSTVAIQEGLTTSGDQVGQWACPLCLSPWSWGAGGETRLMVFGDSQDDLRRDDRYAYIGHVSDNQNNLINFLKGAKMLETIGGRPINRNTVLEVLDILNKEVEAKLSGLPETVWIKASDPSLHWRASHYQVYCEHENLSLRRPGKVFPALCMQGVKPRVLEPYELDLILDIISATLNFEEAAVSGPAEKRMRNELSYNFRVQQIRQLISRM